MKQLIGLSTEKRKKMSFNPQRILCTKEVLPAEDFAKENVKDLSIALLCPIAAAIWHDTVSNGLVQKFYTAFMWSSKTAFKC